MSNFIQKIPWLVIIVLCLTLGLAPFTPQPHLVEKISLLLQGELHTTIDIFDLIFHGIPFVLLTLKALFLFKQ